MGSEPRQRGRQLPLFGEARGGDDPLGPVVGPAPEAGELAGLAARLPAGLRFGTSSWSFPGWRGLVYDRAASQRSLARFGLAAYARHPLLRSVGLDRSFYALLGRDELAALAEVVPEDFRFLVKANRGCTTPRLRETGAANPHYLDPGFASERVVAPFVEGLGPKADVLLFQFEPLRREDHDPPEAFAERVARFLAALPPGPRYAVELRNAAPLVPRLYAALRDAGALPCFNLHPRVPPLAEQRRSQGPTLPPALVVRWMLHRDFDYAGARERHAPFDRLVDADPVARGAVAELCVEALAAGRPVTVIVNNKAEGSAPRSIEALAREIDRRLA